MKNKVYPKNAYDAYIGNIILSSDNNDYTETIRKDKRLDTARYLGGMGNGLFAWLNIGADDSVLLIGSLWGSYIENILSRCKQAVILEKDPFIASCVKFRMRKYKNAEFRVGGLSSLKNDESFNIIILVPDESGTEFHDKTDFEASFFDIKHHLSDEGRMYAVIPNRLGTKYLCGAYDDYNNNPFENITDHNSNGIYRFDKAELSASLFAAGFSKIRFYYPFPDYLTPQLIYSDDHIPKAEIKERLKIFVNSPENRVLSEKKLAFILAQNDVLNTFSNYFIAECSNSEISNIMFAAISSERNRERAFATVIVNYNIVKKIPIYPDGTSGIETLCRNASELIKRNIPSLEIRNDNGIAVMEKVDFSTLSEHIRSIVKTGNTHELLKWLDLLYKYICSSSEISEVNNYAYLSQKNDWGIILSKAFVEMIPVNCFVVNNDLLFYDQEYTLENCPAGYVMFRAINDIYRFIPETSTVISIDDIKLRYSLTFHWNDYIKMEEAFCRKLVNADIYTGRASWMSESEDLFKRNRKALKMESNAMIKLFDPTHNVEGKKIILFGSGRYADYYLSTYGMQYKPDFIVDNNSEKWGTEKNGIPVRFPEMIKSLINGTYTVIITVADFIPVEHQIIDMGITDYRIFNKQIVELIPSAISNTISEEKYNIGYVTGAFDLFHIGHLNILKNSKSRCHYLIAGVLTDEIIIDEKHKTPFIPFEERIEIVKQCKYVDRVVAIDKHNTNKIDAWRELKFGCLFSGSDHADDEGWQHLRSQLRSLGSELEFFPYTQSTNSTMLQNIIRNEIK